MLAAFASVLLASCSTSDPDMPFGFATTGSTPLASQPADFSSSGMALSADAEAATVESVIEEGDPSLPDAVADAPSIRPGQPADAAVAQAQEAEATVSAEEQQPAAAPQEQVTAQADPAAEAGTPVPATAFAPQAHEQQAAPQKRGFLASLFNSQPQRQPARPAETQAASPAPAQSGAQPAARPLIQLASNGEPPRALVASSGPPLPGVREGNALFDISRRDGLDGDDDIDIDEGQGLYRVASAAGLARLAPNGLLTQTDNVDVACLKPSLVRMLKTIESHFGRKVIVTSGYRNPQRNRSARGARNSLHMYCAAADVQVEGVSKQTLAQFARSMPGRGGVGTYCHTDSVHIDVGPERDWNWRCRRRR